MFTGIISDQVVVTDIQGGEVTVKVSKNASFSCDELNIGQSIAHDGACMSITAITDDSYSFFAMQESFDKTNFSAKDTGDVFNIEFCMKAGTRLDGHFVTGHVDTVGIISSVSDVADGSRELRVKFDEKFDVLLVPKGSVTINGVALTVGEVDEGRCSVWLIPQTLEKTNLSLLGVGSLVNLEFDLLAKYVTKYGRS